jgi:uncharacterized protein DUF3723
MFRFSKVIVGTLNQSLQISGLKQGDLMEADGQTHFLELPQDSSISLEVLHGKHRLLVAEKVLSLVG